MREIVGAFKQINSVLEEVNMSKISVEDIFYEVPIKLMTKYYIIVKDVVNKDQLIALDLSDMLTTTTMGRKPIPNWEELSELITDKIVYGYRCPLPNFDDVSTSLITSTVLNDDHLEISYGNWRVPSDRNVRLRRFDLVDLIITKTNPKTCPYNFNNCVVSVNGLVSRPYVHSDTELYSLDSASFTHGNTTSDLPSVVLLDFTNLGKMTIVPFSKCNTMLRNGGDRRYKEYDNSHYAGFDIEFFLPEDINIIKSTIFPVVAHSMFFPQKIKITGEHSLVLSPSLLPISDSLLKLYSYQNKYLLSTDIVQTKESLEDYLTTTMFDEKHSGGFFIVIDTPRIYMKKRHAKLYGWNIHTTIQDTTGVLYDETSQSFLDHVRMPYATTTDYYVERPKDIWHVPICNSKEIKLKKENENDQIEIDKHENILLNDYLKSKVYGLETLKCEHNGFMRNLADSNMYVIQMTR